MIEEEAESLESSVSIFATRLDERREIILHSEEYHNKMKAVRDSGGRAFGYFSSFSPLT